ncbi:dynein axonemal assembly factor 5 isoform X2 [Arctopsyche grandis]|uniref:dynein axonemal assembly factor 5 isoform X2 n=1 Tax=Arctopsyche grandis TaxID=121162 RepID=UPI00406D85CA
MGEHEEHESVVEEVQGAEEREWGVAVEGLRAEERQKRRSALTDLETKLRNTSDNLLPAAFNALHSSLTTCLADETESCRQLTINILSEMLARLPPSDYILTYVVPAIKNRITSTPPESSEELRHALIKLLNSVIVRYGHSETVFLVPFFDDLVEILVKAASDDCPDVKKETCETVANMANAAPKDFHMRSETLCMAILAVFQHRHFKVRVAAVQCIGTIVMNGNEKCFESSVLPMAMKLFDECNPVRLQVTKEVGNWMLNYRERYSYWQYMIPLILTSLCDFIPDIQKEANSIWDSVGIQYMKENEEDLNDQTDTEKPKHYPPVPRPNLGCRTLVMKNMGKILPAISKELDGWQTDAQLRSAQVLCSLILNAEAKNVQYGTNITNCLTEGVKNDDPRVVAEIQRAAELFGYFVGPHVWWNLLICDLDTWQCLVILTSVIKSTPVEQLRVKYLNRIFKELTQPRLRQIQKPKYQMNILNVCEAVMNVCGVYCQCVSQEMFDIIFVIHSVPATTDIEHHALCLIEKLRETIKFGSNIEDLYCHYIRHLLANITSSICFWTLITVDRCILNTILIHTGPAIGLHLHYISPLLSEALSLKGIDPEVKLELFTTLCSVLLRRDEHFRLAEPDKLTAFLNVILRDVILPNLSWNVGQSAEALRTAAVCCLCAILQDNESVSTIDGDVKFDKCIQQVEIFSDVETLQNDIDLLLPNLLGLTGDNSKNTRLYSLRAIRSLVILAKKRNCFSVDHLHQTYSAVISRLDDCNDKVRLFAVETLCTLFMARPESYDVSTNDSHIEAVYNAMLIHLDDPDTTFQDFVLDALKKLCVVHPKMLKGKVDISSKVYKNTKALEHLDKHLESLSI